jgi:hypothetical protein
MSRPQPKVLLELLHKDSFKYDQILESDAIWAVYYNNEPFNLKSGSFLINNPAPKYKKVSFSNPGHARNLAKKLNSMFSSTQFSVVILQNGQVV